MKPLTHGYTLLQLLCYLTIILILGTLFTNDFNNLFNRYRMRTTITKLQKIILFAQTQAILHNTTLTIKSSENNWRQGVIISDVKKIWFRFKIQPIDNLTWHGFNPDKFITILPTGLTFNNGHFSLQVNHIFCQLFVNNGLKTRYSCADITSI